MAASSPSSLELAMSELLFSSAYHNLSELMLPDDNGVLHSASNFTQQFLSRHCDNPVVAEYAKGFVLPQLLYQIEKQKSMPLPVSRVIFTFIFALVGCLGVVGNLLTVWVIYSTTAMQSQTNIFIASLACSDLLLLLVGVPFDLVHMWKVEEIMRAPAYCQLASTSISLFTFASTLTIVSLTSERFVAICYPFSLRALFDRKKVIRLVYFIWGVAFFPSLFIGLQFKLVTRDFCGVNQQVGYGTCDFVDAGLKYSFEIAAVLTFVLPLLFIVYCYIRILHSLNVMSASRTVVRSSSMERKWSKMQSNASTEIPPLSPVLYVHRHDSLGPPTSQQAQKIVIKMLVTVCAVFFLCYLPYHIERLIVVYTSCTSTLCLLLYPISGLLQYVSATANPLLYNLMSLRFRAAFRRLVREFILRHKRDINSMALI